MSEALGMPIVAPSALIRFAATRMLRYKAEKPSCLREPVQRRTAT